MLSASCYTLIGLFIFSSFAQGADFALRSRPSIGTVMAGDSITYSATIYGAAGYTGNTELSLVGLPQGASATFAPASKAGTGIAVFTISTSSSTAPGSYQLILRGVHAEETRDETLQLEVKSHFAFIHPGVLLAAPQLASMAAHANTGDEPWKNALAKVKSSELGPLVYTPTPLVSVNTDISAEANAIVKDSQAAYTQALLWSITRNPVYAENSIHIMDAWARTFKGGFSGGNYMNTAAWTGDNWPRAAEIIRYTWLNPDGSSKWGQDKINAFKQWLAEQYIPLVIPGRSYGYYGGNLNESSASAAIQIGVFNDDPKTFFRGIWMWRYMLPAYIYSSSDGPDPAPPINWSATQATTANINALWYNQRPLLGGLAQETCRDLGHVRWGFAALANGAETAYLQNIDLYSEHTFDETNSGRIKAGLEFNSRYLNGAAVPAGLCGGKIVMGSSVGTGELAYNELVNRLHLQLPELDIYLNTQRPTASSYFMNWETLTHFANP